MKGIVRYKRAYDLQRASNYVLVNYGRSAAKTFDRSVDATPEPLISSPEVEEYHQSDASDYRRRDRYFNWKRTETDDVEFERDGCQHGEPSPYHSTVRAIADWGDTIGQSDTCDDNSDVSIVDYVRQDRLDHFCYLHVQLPPMISSPNVPTVAQSESSGWIRHARRSAGRLEVTRRREQFEVDRVKREKVRADTLEINRRLVSAYDAMMVREGGRRVGTAPITLTIDSSYESDAVAALRLELMKSGVETLHLPEHGVWTIMWPMRLNEWWLRLEPEYCIMNKAKCRVERAQFMQEHAASYNPPIRNEVAAMPPSAAAASSREPIVSIEVAAPLLHRSASSSYAMAAPSTNERHDRIDLTISASRPSAPAAVAPAAAPAVPASAAVAPAASPPMSQLESEEHELQLAIAASHPMTQEESDYEHELQLMIAASLRSLPFELPRASPAASSSSSAPVSASQSQADQTSAAISAKIFARNLICYICTEYVDQAIALSCGHCACGWCIEQWLVQSKGTCGICRAIVGPSRARMWTYDTMHDDIAKDLYTKEEWTTRIEMLKERTQRS